MVTWAKLSEEEKQVKTAIANAKRKAGSGWRLLGFDLQQALVRGETLSLIAAGAAFEKSFAGRVASRAITYNPEHDCFYDEDGSPVS